MNDLFFNSWCYNYTDKDTKKIKLQSSSPLQYYQNSNINIGEIMKELNIIVPEKDDIITRGMCDKNILFNEMVWVIKLMSDLSKKNKKVFILEHCVHLKLDDGEFNHVLLCFL